MPHFYKLLILFLAVFFIYACEDDKPTPHRRIEFGYTKEVVSEYDSQRLAAIYIDTAYFRFGKIKSLCTNGLGGKSKFHDILRSVQDTNIIFLRKTILGSLYGKEDSVIQIKGSRYVIQLQSTYLGGANVLSDDIPRDVYFRQEMKRGYFIQNSIAQKALSINYIYLDINSESYILEFYYKVPNETFIGNSNDLLFDYPTRFKKGRIDDKLLYEVAYKILEKTRKKRGKNYYKIKQL